MTTTGAGVAELLDRALADGLGPGIVAAIVDRDGTHDLAAAGQADVDGARPMTTDHAFAIGSVSKTLTSAAVLRLRDEGRLDLDDPVVRHLPEVRGFQDPFGGAERATIRDLLRHTAGLPCESPSPDPRRWEPLPVEAVLADPSAATWAIPPGAAHKYSNLGYDLLGAIIARATGRPYEASVREAILAPLGMSSTTVGAGQMAATGHGPPDDAGHRPVAGAPPPSGGSGGWWSTGGDLARWLGHQLKTRADPSGGGAEAHRPIVVTDPRLDGAYGLGWRVTRRGDHVHVGHGGLTTGFEARIEADVEAGIGVVVLLSGIGPGSAATVALASELFRLGGHAMALAATGGAHAPAPFEALAVPAGPHGTGDPTSLAGRYREVGFASLAVVEAVPGGWWFRADDDPGGPLIATPDPDRFRLEHGRLAGEWVVVLRDGDGRVDGINVAGYPHARLPG